MQLWVRVCVCVHARVRERACVRACVTAARWNGWAVHCVGLKLRVLQLQGGLAGAWRLSTIKPVLKNTGSHDNDNGAKRRVTK